MKAPTKRTETARKRTQAPQKVESCTKGLDERICVPIEPMGAVRLSSSDRWSKRPVAQRYFDWKNRFKLILSQSDLLKEMVSQIEKSGTITIIARHSVPESWPEKKKNAHYGIPMKSKPDWDNVSKAVCDVLFKQDSFLYRANVMQYYVLKGSQPEIEIKQ